jgi:hypothetical protein
MLETRAMTEPPHPATDPTLYQDRRPVPDPTALTTAALQRDNFALRELLEAKIEMIQMRLDERYAGIISRFAERDLRMSEQAEAYQANVRTALEAATRQIEALAATALGARTALDSRIGDIKDRLTVIEARRDGVSSAFTWIFAGAGVVIAAGGLLVGRLLTK